MYKDFYQLVTNPFRLAPEPDFCFSHTGYKRAREYLEFALAQGEGFVMVTGRPGTGKTMLVETFLKTIDNSDVIARRIAVSSYGAADLLRAVAYAYGIDAVGMDKGTLRYRIQQFFVQQEQVGRRVLLIIDEAQTLSHAALEELRILADMQTQSRLMLQLFLVGQESLQELMRIPNMEQFQQRVIANYHLASLNLKDTRSYIEHRLLQAGWRGDPEFSGDAVLGIYQLSNGVPRHINKICNRLLLLGYGKCSHTIGEQDVREISAEMREERLTPMSPNQPPHYDTDNVTNITEIRDNQLSIADLAIRADKVDACVAAIAEGSRQAAENEEAFIDRHNISPASRDELISQADNDTAATVAITTEPLHAANESLARTRARHSHDSVKVRRTHRLGWNKTLVAMALPLILLTVLFATVSSFPGREALKSILSYSDYFSRPAPPLATLQDPSGTSELDSDIQAKADDTNRASSLETNRTSSLQHADTTKLTNSEASEQPPDIGVVDRHQAEAAVTVQPPPVTKTIEQTDVIQTGNIEALLAQGQQALDDYRLMTPDGDNAYEYLIEVLQLDPQNETARAGIQEIVDIYITLAEKAADSKDMVRAGRYLDRGLGIQPDNPELLAMKESFESKMESPPVAQLSAGPGEQSTRDSTTLRKQLPLRKRQARERRRDISAMSDGDH